MDTTTAISAAATPAAQADKPITAADYHTLGRRQAEFWAGQAETARKSGTDKVSLGFKDLVDLVNPLQHIPIVRNIYQAVTGDDDMKPAVKFVGDTMFGGPLAAVSSGVDAVVKQASGKDMMQTALSWFTGDDGKTNVADNTAASTAASAANNNIQVASNTVKLTDPSAAAAAAQPAIEIPKFGLASTGPSPAITTPAAQQVAAVPPSAYFNGLQRNNASGAKMPIAPSQANTSLSPTGRQFAGFTPAALKTMTDGGVGVGSANLPSAGAVIPASTSANANLASSAVMSSGDSLQNPQSDFAQKMLAALDHYQAAKKAGGDASSAPAVSQGL